MRRTLVQVAAVLIISTCMICPALEMFDHWDHVLRTGKDTESVFVILALCGGAAILLAGTLARVSPKFVTTADCHLSASFESHPFFLNSLTPVGQPPPPLRI